MTSQLYAISLARFRAACAEEIGCDVASFLSNDLTVVERPSGSPAKYVALVFTFGTGTVLSVDPHYLELARSLQFKKHYLAFRPQSVVLPLVRAAQLNGEKAMAWGPALGFLLNKVPVEPPLPEGLHLEQLSVTDRQRWYASGAFSNALGEPADSRDSERWLRALALMTADGEPAAMSGAYRDRGEHQEIGIDVSRRFRGRGLASTMVSLLIRDILDQGSHPTYYCAASNIRSHRTALACGLIPTFSVETVESAG